jgi:O-antigen ligase
VLDGELRRKFLRRSGVVLLAALIVMPVSLSLFSQVVTNFSNSEENLSTDGRAGDYEVVRAMVAERPLFGLGDGQFSASETRLVEGRRIKTLWLDNDYLLALVRAGLLGLAALVALPVVGVAICRASRRRTGSQRISVISNCCMVAIVTSALTWAFFDASAFRMNRSFFFVILAIAGILDNLTRGEEERRGTELQGPEVPSRAV